MASEAYVVGVGMTKVGRLYESSLEDLFFQAALQALESSGSYDVDAVVVANVFAPKLQGQSLLAPVLAEELGLKGVQTFTVEAGGASGIVAVHVAKALIESEEAERALVVGVEKTSDATSSKYASLLSQLLHASWESIHGATLASSFALVASAYMLKHGVSEELLAEWPVFMHENAHANAQHAQFRSRITVEQVLSSSVISYPLRVLHAHQEGDGAAAVVISKRGGESKLARITATSVANHLVELALRDELHTFPSARLAARALLKKAKLEPRDLDLVEVCDKYSIAGPITLEELGLADYGKSLAAVKDGRYRAGDKPTVNLAGGVKARGHPVGATGVYQVAEIVSALHGLNGVRGLPQAERCVAICIGGVGSVAAGAVVERA